MDENPGGTPNPLNPDPDSVDSNDAPKSDEEVVVGTGILDYTETDLPSEKDSKAEESASEPDSDIKFAEPKADEVKDDVAKPAVKPASFAQTPETRTKVEVTSVESEEDLTKEEPIIAEETAIAKETITASSMPDIPVAKPSVRTGGRVIDPMMRPKNSNFDTLAMEETETEVVSEPAYDATQNLVAKDSIVEPAGGGRKKAFIIGAIVLLIVGIICGAAAIAIAVVGNSGDRVTKAIDKLLNGEISSIVAVDGSITTATNDTTTTVDFDGTFDTKSPMNKVTADVSTTLPGEVDFNIGVDEVTNNDGETFFRVSGLMDLINPVTTLDTTEATNLSTDLDATNCVNDSTGMTNCVTTTSGATSELLNAYAGVFEAIDNEWILINSDFGNSMEGLGLFDNNSTCLINAVATLPKYSKDIANKYKANPFITYSTDNIKIAKKKNTLYRLGFDKEKLTAFINSLSNNGFINELNACAGNTATNGDITSDLVEVIFANSPTIYVEIDDKYNFTRVYFDMETETGDISSSATADLQLSYPNGLKIEEPENYINMSTLLNKIMTGLFSGGDIVIDNTI